MNAKKRDKKDTEKERKDKKKDKERKKKKKKKRKKKKIKERKKNKKEKDKERIENKNKKGYTERKRVMFLFFFHPVLFNRKHKSLLLSLITLFYPQIS